MIKSMTGFASLTHEGGAATVSTTVKGVNHRFLDLQFRMSGTLAPIESRLRAIVQQKVGRGRLEIAITVQPRLGAASVAVEVNDAVVQQFHSWLENRTLCPKPPRRGAPRAPPLERSQRED